MCAVGSHWMWAAEWHDQASIGEGSLGVQWSLKDKNWEDQPRSVNNLLSFSFCQWKPTFVECLQKPLQTASSYVVLRAFLALLTPSSRWGDWGLKKLSLAHWKAMWGGRSRVTQKLPQRKGTCSEHLLCASLWGMCFLFNTHKTVVSELKATAFFLVAQPQSFGGTLSCIPHIQSIKKSLSSSTFKVYLELNHISPFMSASPAQLITSPSWILLSIDCSAWVIHLEPRSDQLIPLLKILQWFPCHWGNTSVLTLVSRDQTNSTLLLPPLLLLSSMFTRF